MAIKLRHQRYWLQVWVPEKLKAAYDNKRHVERNLYTSDRKVAVQRAATVEGLLRAEFAELLRGGTEQSETAVDVRRTYEATFAAASAGEYRAYIAPLPGMAADPVADGIGLELDRLEDAHGQADLSPIVAARVAGLQDASARHTGQAVPHRAAYEWSFTDVADDFMKMWLATTGTKVTNTEQQKRATFKLFAGFWNNKPMRSIDTDDAAAFHDALLLLDPHWARKASNANQSWSALIAEFGGRKRGLSAATVNRHLAALKTLWDWARTRKHCEGDNPFQGFHTKLKVNVNFAPYLAWEPAELNALLRTPPKRRDLLEVILVGLHSGMRLDEIASLTWGQVQEADGVTFFQVTDAKTPAGNRQVPVHPALSWLTGRTRGPETARLWPAFNPEGPGKKPGADAGRDFSRFKSSRGFTSRAKTFHSFRKCVTRIMEQAGVPENDWAQVFGHERGFTYRVYNPDGITLARKAEMIALIAYPKVNLPVIAA